MILIVDVFETTYGQSNGVIVITKICNRLKRKQIYYYVLLIGIYIWADNTPENPLVVTLLKLNLLLNFKHFSYPPAQSESKLFIQEEYQLIITKCNLF